MPDRDTDLTRLFVRDLHDIPLPPQGRWRPTPRERSPLMTFGRAALTTGAVVAVLPRGALDRLPGCLPKD